MKALYDHKIEFIEPTKLLEREICDTMTVTNSLQKIFANGAIPISVEKTEEVGMYQPDVSFPHVTYPIQVGQALSFSAMNTYTQFTGGTPNTDRCNVSITSPGGAETSFGYTIPVEYQVLEEGTYSIVITYSWRYSYGEASNLPGAAIYRGTFTSFINAPQSSPWTITDVVNRLLSAGETRRIGIDEQKYVFDAEQAEKYSTVLAPEFFFTRGTLRDALDTVGAFIHGIPRLLGDYKTIRFDELGANEEFTGTLPPPIYVDEQISGEEYCNEIDSPAQNLLNTMDKASGAVTMPEDTGWRAINSTTTDISANTMTALADEKMYQVTGFWCKWGSGGEEKDLFPYLYERAEYEPLSSYSGEAYPYSKGWALCYEQGGSEITGFNFTLQVPTNQTANQNYAIVNIFNALGVNIGGNDADFANNLFYRITYIPLSSLRVTQKKPYLTHNGAGTLIYNQTGNTVESEFFGRKMKGTIARIGNKIKRRTYLITKLKNLPHAGQIYYPDGAPEKITNVDREFDLMRIKATVTSVPNFNRLAEYTGVNSNYRLYDISERQTGERFVHYEETVVLSNYNRDPNDPTKPYLTHGNPIVLTFGEDAYSSMFSAAAERDSVHKASTMFIVSKAGRTEEDAATGLANANLWKACASFGFGNSLVFYTNMEDNYGAGRQSSDDYWTSSDKRRTSKQLRYPDVLGNISTMGVYIVGKETFSQTNAFLYPESLYPTAPRATLISTGGFSFLISKDSREALNITIQLHHQADDLDIIIGPGLCKFNPLVSAKRKCCHFMWVYDKVLDRTDPKLDQYGDITSGLGEFPTGQRSGYSVKVPVSQMVNNTDRNVVGWAICAMKTDAPGAVDEIVLAQNYPDGIAKGSSPKDVYIHFVDNKNLADLCMAE